MQIQTADVLNEVKKLEEMCLKMFEEFKYPIEFCSGMKHACKVIKTYLINYERQEMDKIAKQEGENEHTA